MKYLPLIWAGLFRKPARTVFTLLSVVVAFLLFGLLQGINASFSAVIEEQHLDRLFADPRVPGGAPMPMSYLPRVAQIPGVTRVCGRAPFFGYYQNPKNGMFSLATDARAWFGVRPEYAMPPEQLAKLEATRDGIAMTPQMMKQFNLELGDRVPITSPVARKDGNPVWTFTLVGTFDITDNPNNALISLINYGYFDEARAQDVGTFDRIIIRIADPTRSAATATAVDKLFANSPHETRTQNEQQQTESAIKQLGDIGFFTNAIVAAVFFTLLFVTGNTMMQSVRERIPEFAVLRTLGFSNTSVLSIVLAESAMLCVIAAIIGLALAAALFPLLRNYIGGSTALSMIVVFAGLIAAIVLSLVTGLLPAMRAKRLRIVEALAVR